MESMNDMQNDMQKGMENVGERAGRRWENMTNWDQIRRDSQRRWNKLTDEDMAHVKNNVNELVGIVQDRYGLTKEQAAQEVDRFMARYDRKVYEMAQNLPPLVRDSMERHPWAAVATALGLGFIFGFVLKPGSHKDRTNQPS